ncbi:unnamed protein product [Gongylonema pulchrum]|uniref:Aa_trans domain-containing protein n=1 Tax=Gongylonema pulchrum TaxID=637853 RepID=A0A183F1N0_9BILA|nr:unnamed protein product [Gongylonema pulchrum]
MDIVVEIPIPSDCISIQPVSGPRTASRYKSVGGQAVAVAVLCTVAAVIMIFVGISLDFKTCYKVAEYPPVTIKAILGLGIFLFAFNGHQVFPTVQNDMRNPADFRKSVIVGFIRKFYKIQMKMKKKEVHYAVTKFCLLLQT